MNRPETFVQLTQRQLQRSLWGVFAFGLLCGIAICVGVLMVFLS